MRTLRHAFSGALALSTFAALTECRDPTEVTLELSTDTDCKTLYKGTSITVGPAGQTIESQTPLTITTLCNGDQTIGTFVVAPSGNKDGQFEVRIVTGIDVRPDDCTPDKQPDMPYKGCIVQRRVMNFVPHTPLELPIEMLVDCKDIACNALSTCVHGNCVPAQVKDPAQCDIASNCDFQEGGAADSEADQNVADVRGDGTTTDAPSDGCTAFCGDAGPDSPPPPDGGPDSSDAGADVRDGGPDVFDGGGPDVFDSGGPDVFDSGGPDVPDTGNTSEYPCFGSCGAGSSDPEQAVFMQEAYACLCPQGLCTAECQVGCGSTPLNSNFACLGCLEDNLNCSLGCQQFAAPPPTPPLDASLGDSGSAGCGTFSSCIFACISS